MNPAAVAAVRSSATSIPAAMVAAAVASSSSSSSSSSISSSKMSVSLVSAPSVNAPIRLKLKGKCTTKFALVYYSILLRGVFASRASSRKSCSSHQRRLTTSRLASSWHWDNFFNGLVPPFCLFLVVFKNSLECYVFFLILFFFSFLLFSSPSVAPASVSTSSGSSGSMMQRKTLPSQPSALVRQQLQLAVATAAAQQQQQRKQPAAKKESSRGGKRSRSAASSAAASADSSDSSSCSPRKQKGSGQQNNQRSSRAGSDSEDNCEKRSQHNSMERQRRVDLRNAFEFLRSLIPDLEATDRAAKVVILKKAANFCQGLTMKEKQFLAEKDALQKRHEILRKRISLLQRRR